MVCVKTTSKQWKVMLRASPETTETQYLQKGVDFVSAYVKGFALQDALAIVRIDGIYVESFHVSDVRQRLRVSVLSLDIKVLPCVVFVYIIEYTEMQSTKEIK